MLLTSSWLERVEGGPEPGSVDQLLRVLRVVRTARDRTRMGIGDRSLVAYRDPFLEARPFREAFSGGSSQGVEKGTPGEPISAPDPKFSYPSEV